MVEKKNGNGWIGIIIIGFIIISNFVWLFPFLIFGIIIYLLIKQKRINTNIGNLKENFDFKNFDSNKLMNNIMDSEFMQKNMEKKSKSKISKPNKPVITHESNNLIYNTELSKSIETDTSINTLNKNTYKTNYKARAVGKSVSSSNKKQKIYVYNGGKSIWDDYETVVDIMNKK